MHNDMLKATLKCLTEQMPIPMGVSGWECSPDKSHRSDRGEAQGLQRRGEGKARKLVGWPQLSGYPSEASQVSVMVALTRSWFLGSRC